MTRPPMATRRGPQWRVEPSHRLRDGLVALALFAVLLACGIDGVTP